MKRLVLLLISGSLWSCQATQKVTSSLKEAPAGPYVGFPFIYDDSIPLDHDKNLHDFATMKAHPSSVSVMWWQTEGVHSLDLYHNLTELSGSELAPDVLLLGDYNASTLSADVQMKLRKVYPHSAFFPLSRRIKKVGIQMYSKFEVKQTQVVEDGLRWVSPQYNDREAWDYMKKWEMSEINRFSNPGWNRNYIRMTIEKNQRLFHIVPIHLCRTWRQVSKLAHDQELGRSDHLKKMKSFEEIVADKSSPIHFQIQHLQAQIKKDTHLSGSQNVILIGNFNASPETTAAAFKLDPFMNRFASAFNSANPLYPSAGQDSPKQLDQVFTSVPQFEPLAFRPMLTGSIQFPIYLLLKSGTP